jgi:hypothetical protein
MQFVSRCPRFAVAGVLLALAGCATTPPIEWSKPGGTRAERDKDTDACDHEVKKAELTMPSAPQGDVLDNTANAFNRGMDLKKLKELCMQTRGYTATAAR